MSEIHFSPEQRAAIEVHGHDLLVTASAGTGKTTVLVERILYKLRHGLIQLLDELLVVTFTEKAAQEMRGRISRELSRSAELRHHLPQLPRAVISTIHAFCGHLLREHFVEARIEPAFRILDEIGQREAMDEALRATFHDWYLLGERGEGKEFRGLVEMTGFDENGEVLKRVVRQLYEFSRVTPDPDAYLASLVSRPAATNMVELPWYPEMLRQLERAWNRGLRLFRAAIDLASEHGYTTSPHESLHEALAELTTDRMRDPRARALFVAGIRQEDRSGACDEDEAANDDRLYPQFCLKFPNAPSGANDRVPGFKELYGAVKKTFNHRIIRALPWHEERLLSEDERQRKSLRVLVDLVRQVDESYKLYKSRSGLLDFSDLEIHTVRLLREHGEDLGLTRRFREVLVDEFQDVNALQDQILSSLSPGSGRFRVGDVKQSIYQFRLADPGIFLRLASGRAVLREPADVPDDGEPLLVFLAENHRSHAPLCDIVNHIFARLFQVETIGSPYAEQALRPARQSGAGNGSLSGSSRESLAGPSDASQSDPSNDPSDDPSDDPSNASSSHTSGDRSDGPSSDALNEPSGDPSDDALIAELHLIETLKDDRAHTELDREARFTALRIDRLVREQRPPIKERDGTTRPIRWRDVVILLRSQTAVDAFLSALRDAEIPAFLAHGGSLLEEEAVRDLRCLLMTIDNPRDDVALAAVLRSPLFALSDSDLLRLRLAWPDAKTFLDAVAATGFRDDADAEGGYFWPAASAAGDAASDARLGVARREYWTGAPASDADSLIPEALRRRVREILERIRTWRKIESEMELGLFLEHLLDAIDLRSILLGRGEMTRQTAGLEKFLDIARAYEAERGPSLHGFLARIASFEGTERIDAVPQGSEEDDAVAILSVHKAKGLEFPVVVLPRLSWRFRRDPLGSKIRIGQEWIGVRWLDYDTWGRRDTSARWVLQEAQEELVREEEKRILYVALTRAREKLILIGTAARKPWQEPGVPEILREDRIRRAGHALTWILESLPWETATSKMAASSNPSGANQSGSGESADENRVWLDAPPLLAEWHPADAISWVETRVDPGTSKAAREAIAGRLPLGPDVSANRGEVLGIIERIARPSPFPPLAGLDDLRGKYWVTEFKRLGAGLELAQIQEEGSGLWPEAPVGLDAPGSESAAAAVHGAGDLAEETNTAGPVSTDAAPPRARDTAARVGTLYHVALSRIDLNAVDAKGLDEQFAAFSRSPWWAGETRDPQIEQGIAAFFRAPLGRALAQAAEKNGNPGGVEREVPFSLKWSLSSLARYLPPLREAIEANPRWRTPEWAAALAETWALLQGRIDCLFPGDEGWVLIDWKTDAIAADQVPARARLYASQMEIYREAASRMWGTPVKGWLVFLRSGIAIEVGTHGTG